MIPRSKESYNQWSWQKKAGFKKAPGHYWLCMHRGALSGQLTLIQQQRFPQKWFSVVFGPGSSACCQNIADNMGTRWHQVATSHLAYAKTLPPKPNKSQVLVSSINDGHSEIDAPQKLQSCPAWCYQFGCCVSKIFHSLQGHQRSFHAGNSTSGAVRWCDHDERRCSERQVRCCSPSRFPFRHSVFTGSGTIARGPGDIELSQIIYRCQQN